MKQYPSDLELFHIHRPCHYTADLPTLKVGDKLVVGSTSNPYFRYLELEAKYANVSVEGMLYKVSPLKFLELVATGDIVDHSGGKAAVQIVRHLTTCIRELVLESIRQEEFPDLPSRQRCLFCSPSLEAARLWLAPLGCESSPHQILRLSCKGHYHTGDIGLISGDVEPIQAIQTLGRQYWRGQICDKPQKEVLFEGEAEVLEVFPTTTKK